MAVVAVRQPFSLPPLLPPRRLPDVRYGPPPVVGAKAAVFPSANAPLDVRIYMAFGADLSAASGSWGWTEVTNYVRTVEGIDISYGRADESSQAQPASCKLALNNPVGDFTPFNANSVYHPYVRRSTPIKVTVNPDTVRHRGPQIRFFGYFTSAKPGWDVSAHMPTVSFEAHGILRRLNQGVTPLRSALYRAVSFSNPTAYWPLEDGASATSAASGIVGGTPLTVVRTTDFAAGGGPAGSDDIVDLSGGGSLAGVVPAGSFTDRWRIEWVGTYADGAAPSAGQTGIAVQFHCTGTFSRWAFLTTGDISPVTMTVMWEKVDGSGNVQLTSNDQVYDGVPRHYRLDAFQSGGNIDITLSINGTSAAHYVGALSAGTLGRIIDVQVNPSATATTYMPSVGHLGIWQPWAGTTDTADAATDHLGETATARITRLCGEQGVSISTTGTSTTAMGPQTQATFLALLRECEAADGGVLSDGQTTGLTFNARPARYNQAAAFTADMSTGQVAVPFVPIDDDQRVRNEWTVKRTNGSEGHAIDEDGPLGTNNVGVYDSSVTINVETDDNLVNEAAWRVHLGTVEGLRYPTLALNLHSSGGSQLIDDWLDASAGSRVDVTNVSDVLTQHPPGTVSVLIEGYTETLRPYDWDVVANCSPVEPWRVQVVGDSTLGRLDTGGSTLASGATSGATSLSVATTTLPLWTTTATFPADFPFDVDIDGEQITVTAITGSSSPQTFTVTRSVNGVVKSHSAGAAVSLWKPAALAL